MSGNSLKQLRDLGQSVWLDYLSRFLISTGRLKQFIDDGITGVTSNPSIFQKAISGSSDYDGTLKEMIGKGERNEKELFIGLAVRDIAEAADIFRPVYDASAGEDGFISIEVSPDLADNTIATIEEAKRLFSAVNRKNVLIKVPATRAGLPAIEELIAQGVSVNVTLLFSVQRYEEVMDAYIRGLERRTRDRKPVNEIFSVASFFVSRVDTLVDKLLEKKIEAASSDEEKAGLRGMLGKAAVVNAKLANRKYREVMFGPRFGPLKEKGAHVQKLLWGSTGTKNPEYSDIKYVEEIIAPHSINTLPEPTINAFMEHGKASITIDERMNEAAGFFGRLESAGILIDEVTDRLEQEGVKLFADAFFSLLKEIGDKRDRILGGK